MQDIDRIEDGTLVIYHGTCTQEHGLKIARPCSCNHCLTVLLFPQLAPNAQQRFELHDPWTGESHVWHVRRRSITRSTAG